MGGRGHRDEDRSQLLPVFRFLVRGWMWFMKLGDAFFLKEE